MKKIVFSLSVLALLSGAALAQQKVIKMTGGPKEINCAVMPKDKVDIVKAIRDNRFADYKGNRYYFCCDGCKPSFKKNPAKYAKAPHTKIPKMVVKTSAS